MAMQMLPEVGDWYMTPAGDSFEVVAYDADAESIEIQYFDGSVEELDLESWLDLGADSVDPPEDYSGSLDLSREDGTAEEMPRSGNPLDDPNL